MPRHPLLVILSRPALHLLLALAFAVAFFWPIFVLNRPAQTFRFLYLAWLLSLVALFFVSRGSSGDAPSVPGEREDADEGTDNNEGSEEAV